jgi:hypothetical protein
MKPNERKRDIVFIQPGYAHYRDQLFNILYKRHGIHFVYERSFNKYPGAVTPGAYSHAFLDRKYGNSYFFLAYFLVKHQPSIVISSVSDSFRSLISFIYASLFKKRFVLWIEEWRKPVSSSLLLKRLWRFIKNFIGVKLIRSSHSLVAGGSASEQYALSLGKNTKDIFVSIQ